MSDFLLLLPFLKSRLSHMVCDSPLAAQLQSLVIQRMSQSVLSHASPGSSLVTLVGELERLRDEMISGTYGMASGRISRLNTMTSASGERDESHSPARVSFFSQAAGVVAGAQDEHSAQAGSGSRHTSRAASVRLSKREASKRLLEKVADEGVARVARNLLPDEPDAADAALSPASPPAAQNAASGQLGDEPVGSPQGADTRAVTSESSLDSTSIAKPPGIELVHTRTIYLNLHNTRAYCTNIMHRFTQLRGRGRGLSAARWSCRSWCTAGGSSQATWPRR